MNKHLQKCKQLKGENMINLEEEFNAFIKAGFKDKELHPIQLQELKRSFYGGLSVAAFNSNDSFKIIQKCKNFFLTEVAEYLDNKPKDSNE